MDVKDIGNTIDKATKAFPKTTNEIDETLSTVVGMFNNIVLYPIQKANIKMQYNLGKFREDMEEKLNGIPKENIKEPSIRMSTSILENLRYSYDEKEIREMYENLLCGSMNSALLSKAHVAYVDIIKNMDILDAKIFDIVFKKRQVPCIFANFCPEDKTRKYLNSMPYVFAPELNVVKDAFIVSSAVVNLQRLGLLEIEHEMFINNFDYDSLKKDPFYVDRLNQFKTKCDVVNEDVHNGVIYINDFGKNFGDICLGGENAS